MLHAAAWPLGTHGYVCRCSDLEQSDQSRNWQPFKCEELQPDAPTRHTCVKVRQPDELPTPRTANSQGECFRHARWALGVGRFQVLGAARLEKRLDHVAALVFEHAACDDETVIEAGGFVRTSG